MKYSLKDLPKPKNCFTVRNATMINLNTGKVVRHYSANTKIVVVQKCVTPEKTYYRTREAAHHYLNYAFEASAFGLPNEIAPSGPSPKTPNGSRQKTRTHTAKNKNSSKTVAPSKDGEVGRRNGWIKNLFRRSNGKTKNC